MATNLTVCCKYSVFKTWSIGIPEGYEWAADGEATQRTCGTYVSFAVRVLGLVEVAERSFWAFEQPVLGADFHGVLHVIPMHAFGARIPDTRFLPGAGILVDGREYTIEEADDRDGPNLDRYRVRAARKGSRLTDLFCLDGHWFFGSRTLAVAVRKAA
jgi:hypothetical protein